MFRWDTFVETQSQVLHLLMQLLLLLLAIRCWLQCYYLHDLFADATTSSASVSTNSTGHCRQPVLSHSASQPSHTQSHSFSLNLTPSHSASPALHSPHSLSLSLTASHTQPHTQPLSLIAGRIEGTGHCWRPVQVELRAAQFMKKLHQGPDVAIVVGHSLFFRQVSRPTNCPMLMDQTLPPPPPPSPLPPLPLSALRITLLDHASLHTHNHTLTYTHYHLYLLL